MGAKACKAPSANSQISQAGDFFKISEFFVKDFCFEVISLGNFSESKIPDSPANTLNSSLQTLSHFVFHGQCYAIVYNPENLENTDSDLTSLLTERELQIATLVASGHPNKQVASQLQISEWTVSAHLRRIFIKLNVDTRAAMVYKCASLINRRVGPS